MNAPVLLRPRSSAPTTPEQLRFLGFAQEIEESGPPGIASGLIYTIAALLVASVAWAALTPVHQIAVAPGDQDQIVLIRAWRLGFLPRGVGRLAILVVGRQDLAAKRRRSRYPARRTNLPVQSAGAPPEPCVEITGIDGRAAMCIDSHDGRHGIAVTDQSVGHAPFGIMFEQHAHDVPRRPQGDGDRQRGKGDQAQADRPHVQLAPPVRR